MNINTLSNAVPDYESVKMAVALYPNNMRKGKDKKTTYHARTMYRSKLNMENIANDILATSALKGYSKEQILEVSRVVNNAIIDRVLNGVVVETELGSYSARVIGRFDSNRSDFNSEKHHVDVFFRSGKKVKELASRIKPRIAQGNIVIPQLITYHDVLSGGDEILTPGGFFEITGKNLCVTGDDPEVGLYFVNTEDESKTVKLEESLLGNNTQGKLAFVVPQLESGTYVLKLVTLCNKIKPRKELLEYLDTKELKVN